MTRRLKKLTDRMAYAWAGLILDWVEMLPTFNGGWIHSLQKIRHRSREHAKLENERFSIPQGVQLELVSITLLRTYQTEDFDLLARALDASDVRDSLSFDRDVLEGIKDNAASVWAGSWANLGILSAQETGLLAMRKLRRLSKLPKEVRFISVYHYKVTPSLHVVAFKAILTREARREFEHVYNKTYLGRVRFKYWFPVGQRAWWRSEGSAAEAKREAVYSFVRKIEREIDRTLDKRFKRPSFSKQIASPVLRELVLKSNQESDTATKDHRAWPRFFGLDRQHYAGYSSEDYTFTFDDYKPLGSATIIVDKTKSPQEQSGESLTDDVAEALYPLLSMRYLLIMLTERLGAERNAVYKRALQPAKIFWFRTDLKLSNEIAISKFISDRFSAERPLYSYHLKHWSGHLDAFKVDASEGLFSAFEAIFVRLENIAREHYGLIERLTRSNTERRNITLTYRLSRQIWIFSIIAVSIACFSSLKDAKQNYAVIKEVASHLMQSTGTRLHSILFH